MFTLQQMKAAHAKVKSGADFPKYVKEIKSLGLVYYNYMVADGTTVYHGTNDFKIMGDAIYQPRTINPQSSADELKHIIAIHQLGQTNFLTFCEQAASAGVNYWTVDTQRMACIYVDTADTEILVEPIPEGDY